MTKGKPISHAHVDVAEVAKGAAAELYDVVMSDNIVRAEWKRTHPGASEKALLAAFVNKNWGKCIPFARATMGRLLVTSTDEDLKARVFRALQLDATLIRGRDTPPIQLQ